MIYTMETISDFCKARDTGERVEIDEELCEYFLEVLPPVHMGYKATTKDGPVWAMFGFAEGAELVTAFWTSRTERKHYAQLTTEINPFA
jgi:hypothetical protein